MTDIKSPESTFTADLTRVGRKF